MRFNSNTTSLGPTKRFLFGRIFPLPFLIIGAAILFFGLRSIQRAKASSDWPSVSGIVVSSAVDSSRGDNGTTYKAEILYDYEVNSTKYSSNRVGYGDYGSSNPSGARQVVNRYKEGLVVDVFYMPESPEESVLEVGIHKRTYFLPAFGLVFFLVGLGILLFLPKQLKKQAEQVGLVDAEEPV